MTSWAGATVAAPSRMRLFLVGILCASACAFEADVPGEDPQEDPNPNPNPTPPARRCTTSGMQMCIDFEGDPFVTDTFGAVTPATNVMATTRDIEKAAHWMGMSWIQVVDNPRLDNANYTIELWTKPAQLPRKMGDQQVGLFDVSSQYQMNLEWDGSIECRFFDFSRVNDDNIDSQIKLAPGGWHHVACTYDKTELRVYVDGKLEGCHPSAKTVNTSGTNGAAIGANIDFGPQQFKNRFDGDLDNVHLYARALGAQEICDAWGYGNCSDVCPEGEGGSD